MLKSAGLRANTSSLAALFLSRESFCSIVPVQGVILHLSSCPGGQLAPFFLSRGSSCSIVPVQGDYSEISGREGICHKLVICERGGGGYGHQMDLE